MKLKHSILAVSLLGMAAANAATISWSGSNYTVSGGFGQTLDTGQFDTTGTQILAENVGGGALPTFDGIDFTAGTIALGGGNFSGFHENTPTANTLLAREGAYGTNGVAATVNLTGLNSGYTLPYDSSGNGRHMANSAPGTPAVSPSGGPTGDAFYSFSGSDQYFYGTAAAWDPP